MGIKTSALLLACMALAACGDEHDNFPENPGPYRVTFSLDASFQGPHGGDPIRIALLRSYDGMVVAEESGTVSAALNPSFSFVTGFVMERGISYEVHYWIDSNIGGGTLGMCDPISNDHQWSFEILIATNDVNFTTSYQPLLMEEVCSTFP